MSDNIDQTIEYQEQILDDLDDIKGSLDEESEYNDKEYQKKVLGSLRSIQKSVEANNLVLYELTPSDSRNFKRGFVVSSDSTVVCGNNFYNNFVLFDVSSYDSLFLNWNLDKNFSSSDNQQYAKYFLTDKNLDYLRSMYAGTSLSVSSASYVTSDVSSVFIDNSSSLPYLVLSYGGTITADVFYSVEEDEPIVPEEPVEVVTTSSTVIIEGLENLTQITTFQSFCSSLLIGILLFLVFVKGLRK